MSRNVRIKLGAVPEEREISIDGQRIEKAITGLSFDASPHGVRITLDVITQVLDYEGDAEFTVPNRVREALLALGWVPPEQARALIRADAAPSGGPTGGTPNG